MDNTKTTLFVGLELAAERVADESDGAANLAISTNDRLVAEFVASREANRRAVGIARARDCRDCGDAIEAERLRAVPEAVRCVECQRLHENDLRLHRKRV